MNNIFAYFALVTEIVGAVGAIRLLAATGTLTGAALYTDISPALATLQQINSKVAIPPALAQSICESVAQTVNQFYHAHTLVKPPVE